MPIHKKNILIPSILAGLAWVGVVTAIFVLKPEGAATFIFFFILLFAAIYLSIMIIFPHKRRAVLIASGIESFLLLRFFQLDTLINLVLLLSLLVTIEVYFWKAKN